MYEPQQDASSSSSGGKTYDSTALTEAASRALCAKAQVQGKDGVESSDRSQTQTGAVEDVARAVRVAELLGLRLVGWCLSHDKVSGQSKVHA